MDEFIKNKISQLLQHREEKGFKFIPNPVFYANIGIKRKRWGMIFRNEKPATTKELYEISKYFGFYQNELLEPEVKEEKFDSEKQNTVSGKKRMTLYELIDLVNVDESEDFNEFKASFEMLQEKKREKAKSEGRIMLDDSILYSEIDKDIPKPDPFQ